MKKALAFLGALIVLGVCAYLIFSPGKVLPADVYPLYSALEWNPSRSTTFDLPGTSTSTVLSGREVVSKAVTNITDLAAVVTPFRTYYEQKLTAYGWKIDTALEADGAGSSVWAYSKKGRYLVFSYDSIFHDLRSDQPAQCPCDLTFKIFAQTIP